MSFRDKTIIDVNKQLFNNMSQLSMWKKFVLDYFLINRMYNLIILLERISSFGGRSTDFINLTNFMKFDPCHLEAGDIGNADIFDTVFGIQQLAFCRKWIYRAFDSI